MRDRIGVGRLLVFLALFAWLSPGSSAIALDFLVNSVSDAGDAARGDGVCDVDEPPSGTCTLRAAMEESEAAFGSDAIRFAIPGSGVHRIAPQTPLPDINDFTGISIDGTTQPGYAGLPLIEIDGTAVTASQGIRITGGHSAVRGLNIHSFGSHGITIRGSHLTTVTACTIGTDPTGTVAMGNGIYGVYIIDSPDNSIGGMRPGDGNVISGNGSDGIHISGGAPDTRVIGNRIGTDAAGTRALGNGVRGITVSGALALRTVIGGADPIARNIISANGLMGISFDDGVSQAQIIGNHIGTDATGTVALGNLWGIYIDNSSSNSIGLAGGIGGNVISGNLDTGVILQGLDASDNDFFGNRIGVTPTGGLLGNARDGIAITEASGNRIGGTGGGDGNVIAGNGRYGVLVESGYSNQVLGNAIHGNGDLGIDLEIDRMVTPNDPGDLDTGANSLQNFPVLVSAVATCAGVTVEGTFDSDVTTSFVLEFFGSAACDPSGHGEGETFLGRQTVITDASGSAPFSVMLPVSLAPGGVVTATATRPARGSGDTSEFSACIAAVNNCVLCGNSRVDPGEECDSGGIDTAACDSDCTLPRCGDRHLNLAAAEECDEGGIDTATCDDDCTLPVCGDDHHNPAAGEQCDDGNVVDGDGCSSSCQIEVCLVSSTRRIVPLMAVKATAGALDFLWPADPAASFYHLNSVASKQGLVDPRTTPRGVGLRECATVLGTTSCTVTSFATPGSPVYYQVLPACGPTGDDEGPF